MNEKNSHFTDLHCHILPGIDDGAQNTKVSKALLEKEMQDGATQFAFTPHFYSERNTIDEFLNHRSKAAAELSSICGNMALHWKLGAEVHMSLDLIGMDLSPLCIEGTNYILLEWPFLSEPLWGEDIIKQVLDAGMRPIFAHIERYEYFFLHPEHLEEYIAKGVVCQINAGALLHKETQKQALALIKRGDVHIICSDAHNMEKRPPRLAEAYEVLRGKQGSKTVERLQNNGNTIFAGEEIETDEKRFGAAFQSRAGSTSGRIKKLRPWQYALMALVAIPVLGAVAFGGLYTSGKNRQQSYSGNAALIADSVPEADLSVDDEGIITVDGKNYRFNDNLITILCMGVDARDNPKLQPYKMWGASGQADTVMLVVFDNSTKEMKIIGISRDTIMQIRAYTADGIPAGTVEDHLSLGWAKADGSTQSCVAMEENVSNLLYGVPIDAYCALNLDGITALNDAVGGVTVTAPNDDLNMKPYYLSQGETTLLKGKTADAFVHNRDTGVDGSNNGRMERQKVYAVAFVNAIKAQMKANPAIIANLYSVSSDYMLTDISPDYAVYLGTNMAQASFSSDDIMTLPGENVYGGQYDEFYVDDAALKQLVLDVFYEEVSDATDSASSVAA